MVYQISVWFNLIYNFIALKRTIEKHNCWINIYLFIRESMSSCTYTTSCTGNHCIKGTWDQWRPQVLKVGGGGAISRQRREPSRGPEACYPGKIWKSGIPEMQFPILHFQGSVIHNSEYYKVC